MTSYANWEAMKRDKFLKDRQRMGNNTYDPSTRSMYNPSQRAAENREREDKISFQKLVDQAMMEREKLVDAGNTARAGIAVKGGLDERGMIEEGLNTRFDKTMEQDIINKVLGGGLSQKDAFDLAIRTAEGMADDSGKIANPDDYDKKGKLIPGKTGYLNFNDVVKDLAMQYSSGAAGVASNPMSVVGGRALAAAPQEAPGLPYLKGFYSPNTPLDENIASGRVKTDDGSFRAFTNRGGDTELKNFMPYASEKDISAAISGADSRGGLLAGGLPPTNIGATGGGRTPAATTQGGRVPLAAQIIGAGLGSAWDATTKAVTPGFQRSGVGQADIMTPFQTFSGDDLPAGGRRGTKQNIELDILKKLMGPLQSPGPRQGAKSWPGIGAGIRSGIAGSFPQITGRHFDYDSMRQKRREKYPTPLGRLNERYTTR